MAKPLEKHYSGKRSHQFWRRVRATKDPVLYLAGCALQDHEGRVMQMLDEYHKRRPTRSPEVPPR